MKQKRYQIISIALVSMIMSLMLYQLGSLKSFENRLWDYRVKMLSEPVEHDDNIKLIIIDQSSLDWAKENNNLSWPWPREMYTAIVDFCVEGGAKAVIFDLIFSEASIYGRVDDERLALSLKKIDSVGVVVLSDKQGTLSVLPSPLLNHVNTKVSQEIPEILNRKKASLPVDTLASSFSVLGSVAATPDDDGVIRQTQLMNYFDDTRIPTLSLAAYLNADKSLKYVQDSKQFCINGECTKFNDSYQAVINFHGPSQTYQSINAAAVIESKLLADSNETASLSPDFFKGNYVFIGVSAPGLMDFRSTPIQGVYPGVEVHATILDNLINNDFISKSPFLLVLFLLIVVSSFNAIGIRLSESLFYASLYPVLSVGVVAMIATISYSMNIWFEITPLLTAILFSAIGAFGVNYFIEGRQRRFIKTAFSQYLSPKVIETLIKYPQTLKLGGKRETLSIFFSDIEGFTKIASQMDAQIVAQFLNEYLALLSNVIMDLGGTIDKYEGDAIIAFWNAPLQQEDHAKLAVSAALKCQQLLDENSEHFLKTYGHTIKTRIGIHTGEVIIGNLGTEKRFDYTFIGDAGNLASRLESANKQFDSYVMISEYTKRAVENEFYCRELGCISVVGRSEPVHVFEPIQNDISQEYKAVLEQFKLALSQMREGNMQTAQKSFELLADSDLVSKKYLQIIDDINKGNIDFKNGVLKLHVK